VRQGPSPTILRMPASRSRRSRPLLGATAVLLVLATAACSTENAGEAVDTTGAEETTSSAPAEDTSSAAAEGSCAYPEDGRTPAGDVTPPPAEPTVEGETRVAVALGDGRIRLTLDADRAPCTVGSFVSLAEQGYFDGTTCHRLTTQGIFVLQCGDPTGSGMGGPGYSFADELDDGETYEAGTVAMANAGPDTNGSQFFVVYEDSLGLPPAYTVFGRLDDRSLERVRAIAERGTDTGAPDGAPKEPVEIESVTVR
jgi:peptidyl-prolyl cis-trans isomerase B (cyclophilin B)